MTQQQYTPVSWQDETTSQQGTLINAERLNQMQTAHHYADGFEEVDTAPTADPGVGYHKIVYCTADNTLYRWDGEAWTADIDDPTRELLEEHEADHDNPHQVTKAQVGLGNVDNKGTVSTWQGTPDDAHIPTEKLVKDSLNGKVDKLTFPIGTIERAYVVSNGKTQSYRDIWVGAIENSILKRTPDGRARASFAVNANTDSTDLVNYGWVSGQLADKADKATTYTKTETDTLLATKLDKKTTTGVYAYIHNSGNQGELAINGGAVASTLPLRDANAYITAGTNPTGTKDNVLTTGTRVQNDLDAYLPMVRTSGNQTIAGLKTFTASPNIKTSNHATTDTTDAWATALIFSGSNNKQIGSISPYFKASGKHEVRFYAYDSDNAARSMVLSSEGYVTIPTRTYNTANDDDAVSIGTLKASTDVVHTSGNETIAGIKTLNNENGLRRITTYARGSGGLATWKLSEVDKDGNNLVMVDIRDDGTYRGVHLRSFGNDGTNYTALQTHTDVATGTTWVNAMTRGYIASASTDVATIGTLDAYTPMVRTSGNQTIQGIKTFQNIRYNTGLPGFNEINFESTTNIDVNPAEIERHGLQIVGPNGAVVCRLFIGRNTNGEIELRLDATMNGTYKSVTIAKLTP